jgi:hypothetical protein
VVDVVGEPNRDAAPARALEGAADDLRGRVVEPDVVEREVERALRGVDEVGDRLRDLGSRLPAVGERANVDQDAWARSFALCARFAAW